MEQPSLREAGAHSVPTRLSHRKGLLLAAFASTLACEGACRAEPYRRL